MARIRMTRLALALLLALGVGGASASDGLAQSMPPGKGSQSMGPGMMGGQGMGPGMMMGGQGMMGCGMNPAMMDSHVEGRIAFLHAELKITPAQAAPWTAYADALRASAKSMADMRTTMTTMMSAAALPERLEATETMLSDRLDALRKIKTAALPLYEALSDEQKALADQLMPAMGMGWGMRGGMGP